MATVEIRGWKRKLCVREGMDEYEDEIQSYFDGRYICGYEAAYMVFRFNIHYRSLVVEQLSFHLQGRKSCTFRANEPLAKNDVDRVWAPRKRGKKIGRLAYSRHISGEIWLLRLLLTKVRGATLFESLRTINGKVCANFQEACRDFGLLDDENEWHQVFSQCSETEIPDQIRQLVTDLNALWNGQWVNMVDDLVKKQREITEFHNILKSSGRSLEDYTQLPQPPHSYLDCSINNLIIEETIHKIIEMEREFLDLKSRCNTKQLEVYNVVMQSVDKGEGGIFLYMVVAIVVMGKWEPNRRTDGEGGDDISVPESFFHLGSQITVESMMESTFPNFMHLIVEKLPGELSSYFSVDTAEDFPISVFDQLALRMKVTRFLDQCVECEVIVGQFKGAKHFILMMELCPTETQFPFILCRKEMPLQVCYAMTINKAQGHSLENVALFLPKGMFTHGQFYVEVERNMS
ncbi:uncharacterized protein LOC141661083 [Apium graveolens]|uniref:uncharacterized protein LOC141661083 n=1 Tax=Apium graveolens TaxID=4045 RepID=UPI003D7A46A9